MRIRSIEAFISAYTGRSMTQASQKLHLTQPALTKMIQTLESELGISLFIRGARGIEPTAHADAFFPRAKRILAELDAAQDEFAALTGGQTGRLRVGSDSYVAAEMLPTAVTNVLQSVPDLKIEIVTGTSDHLATAIEDGDLDFFVTSVSRSVNLTDLVTISILQERYCVVARANHPLTSGNGVTLADIAEYPWINIGDNFALSSNIVPIFEQMGVRLPKKIVETDSISYLVAHLLRSDSLSYQPSRLLETAGLTALNIEDAPGALGQFKVVAAHRKDRPLSRGADLLLQQLAMSTAA